MTKHQSNQAFNTAAGQQSQNAANAQSSYNAAQGDIGDFKSQLANYAAQNPYVQGGQFQTSQNQQMADTAAAGSTVRAASLHPASSRSSSPSSSAHRAAHSRSCLLGGGCAAPTCGCARPRTPPHSCGGGSFSDIARGAGGGADCSTGWQRGKRSNPRMLLESKHRLPPAPTTHCLPPRASKHLRVCRSGWGWGARCGLRQRPRCKLLAGVAPSGRSSGGAAPSM